MDATLHLAEEWEKQPMLKRDIRVNIFFNATEKTVLILLNAFRSPGDMRE
jgi:hypothetical protein